MSDVNYMKALGLAIRDVRRERGLTISELHYRTRMSHQAVAKIERGDVFPKLDSILSICQALEVKPSTLFAMADSES
jgi:transcriptional regulator with XRE-family HTH domain